MDELNNKDIKPTVKKKVVKKVKNNDVNGEVIKKVVKKKVTNPDKNNKKPISSEKKEKTSEKKVKLEEKKEIVIIKDESLDNNDLEKTVVSLDSNKETVVEDTPKEEIATKEVLEKTKNFSEKTEENKNYYEIKNSTITKEKNKRVYTLAELITVLCIGIFITLALTYMCTYLLIKNENKEGNSVINIKPTDDKELNEFISTYESILNNYYEDLDKKTLIEGAIKGMTSTLDDYSDYFTEDEASSFNTQMSGEIVGIGAEIQMLYEGDNAGMVAIFRPLPDSPAEKAGLKAGDIFLEVNGQDVTKYSTEAVSSLVRGAENSDVSLKMKRGDQTLDLVIKRKRVIIKSVSSKIYNEDNKKIGYIKIDLFAENTYTQFSNELAYLEKEKVDSLIIDVRNNSGGYLHTVDDILKLFLSKNDIIYQIQSKDKTQKFYGSGNGRNIKVVVLANAYSASASEILAGAFKEGYKNGMVIGEVTFGKGTVQTTNSVETGGMIKLTTQRWLTSGGNSIDKAGVTPNIEVKNSTYDLNVELDKDLQLQRALTELKK